MCVQELALIAGGMFLNSVLSHWYVGGQLSGMTMEGIVELLCDGAQFNATFNEYVGMVGLVFTSGRTVAWGC